MESGGLPVNFHPVSLNPSISLDREATLAFVRRARRIRARCAGDAEQMHRQLNVLARSTERFRLDMPVLTPGERFAKSVEAMLEGPVLRYSARQELLDGAGELGIDRFAANLIIAQVQHDMSRRPARNVSSRVMGPSTASPSRLLAFLTVVLIQTAIVACVCLLMR